MKVKHYFYYCIFNFIINTNCGVVIEKKLSALDDILNLCNLSSQLEVKSQDSFKKSDSVALNDDFIKLEKSNNMVKNDTHADDLLNIDSLIKSKGAVNKSLFEIKDRRFDKIYKNDCSMKRVHGINRTDHRCYSKI